MFVFRGKLMERTQGGAVVRDIMVLSFLFLSFLLIYQAHKHSHYFSYNFIFIAIFLSCLMPINISVAKLPADKRCDNCGNHIRWYCGLCDEVHTYSRRKPHNRYNQDKHAKIIQDVCIKCDV